MIVGLRQCRKSIQTHVVTFDIAKHFILIETLFFKRFTFSAHKAAETGMTCS